jgi:hypothetical protein
VKIHTRVVTCMTTGEVLEDEYYEYEGPVDLCSSGGSYEVPETPEEKELAKISLEKWNRYKDVYRPLEDKYMAKVDNMTSDAAYDRIGGLTGNAIVAGAGSQMDAGNQAMFQGGINPNSGKFMGANSTLMSKGSKVLSSAVNQANRGLGTEKIARMEGIVNIGQGQASDAVKGLSDIAASSVDTAEQRAKGIYNDYQGTLESVGTIGGAGLRGYMEPSGSTPS